MTSAHTCSVWTFTALHGVAMNGRGQVALGKGFPSSGLTRFTRFLLSAGSDQDLSKRELNEMVGLLLDKEV